MENKQIKGCFKDKNKQPIQKNVRFALNNNKVHETETYYNAGKRHAQGTQGTKDDTMITKQKDSSTFFVSMIILIFTVVILVYYFLPREFLYIEKGSNSFQDFSYDEFVRTQYR